MTLPEGWVETTLDTITREGSPICYGVLKPGDPSPGGVRMVRVTDIRRNKLDESGLVTISDELDHEFHRSRVAPGDVLISVQGTVGRVAVVPDTLTNANISRTIARIRLDEDIEPRWLWRALRAPKFQSDSGEQVAGTTRDSLNIGTLRQLNVPLPPAAEQRRIVTKLDALTARIARARGELDRVSVLAKKLRQNVLHEAFTSGVTDAIALTDLVEEVRYGTAKKCDYATGQTPVLRIPNIQSGRINLADLKSANFDEKERAKLALRLGDVLVIRSNGSLDLVGRSAVVSKEAVGMLYAGYLIRLRPDLNVVQPAYLQHCLSSPGIRSTIESAARSSTGVNNVNAEQLKDLRVPLRSLAEQGEAVDRIEAAFARAHRLETQAARARSLLDRLEAAILARAFRGELVPQDPNEEPASALLARIGARRAAAPTPKRGRRARESADA